MHESKFKKIEYSITRGTEIVNDELPQLVYVEYVPTNPSETRPNSKSLHTSRRQAVPRNLKKKKGNKVLSGRKRERSNFSSEMSAKHARNV
jgi:hypothetical protein